MLKNAVFTGFSVDGADNRSRTYDLRITNALLYQLSYIGPARRADERKHGIEG